MPARLSCESSSAKPNGSIKCSVVRVAAQSRATLPVLGGISGSTRTMCMQVESWTNESRESKRECVRHAGFAELLLAPAFLGPKDERTMSRIHAHEVSLMACATTGDWRAATFQRREPAPLRLARVWANVLLVTLLPLAGGRSVTR